VDKRLKVVKCKLKSSTGRPWKPVIASKITGGSNVTPRNIKRDIEGSLKRLGTDYMDLYLLHWPARYTPQSNWGQSLMYHVVGRCRLTLSNKPTLKAPGTTA
jgi:aryl-alcohol dehydrogenase-like predicted oxidoreductase